MDNIYIYENKNEVAFNFCKYFQKLAIESIKILGKFIVALSGGRTPVLIHQILTSEPFLSSICWNDLYIFQVDERFVPRDHPDNNFKMIQETLIEKAKVPSSNCFAMNVDFATPVLCARDYQQRMEAFFEDKKILFDLIILGVGEDGHTASLFPDTDILLETKLHVSTSNPKTANHSRVSLTFPVINSARRLAILAIGESKAPVISALVGNDEQLFPVQKISNSHITLFLDEGASSLIDRSKCLCYKLVTC